MAFSTIEKEVLLSVKFVGPTVLQRFEEIGIDSLVKLATHHVDEIADMISSMLNSSCWKNSPQAKRAIAAAIERAQTGL